MRAVTLCVPGPRAVAAPRSKVAVAIAPSPGADNAQSRVGTAVHRDGHGDGIGVRRALHLDGSAHGLAALGGRRKDQAGKREVGRRAGQRVDLQADAQTTRDGGGGDGVGHAAVRNQGDPARPCFRRDPDRVRQHRLGTAGHGGVQRGGIQRGRGRTGDEKARPVAGQRSRSLHRGLPQRSPVHPGGRHRCARIQNHELLGGRAARRGRDDGVPDDCRHAGDRREAGRQQERPAPHLELPPVVDPAAEASGRNKQEECRYRRHGSGASPEKVLCVGRAARAARGSSGLRGSGRRPAVAPAMSLDRRVGATGSCARHAPAAIVSGRRTARPRRWAGRP